jgi:hypothetical protein
LRLLLTQRLDDCVLQKTKGAAEEQKTAASPKKTSAEDSEAAFEAWLERKKKQRQREKRCVASSMAMRQARQSSCSRPNANRGLPPVPRAEKVKGELAQPPATQSAAMDSSSASRSTSARSTSSSGDVVKEWLRRKERAKKVRRWDYPYMQRSLVAVPQKS